jgi:hypothetical protein
MLALEDALPIDSNPPLAFRPALHWCRSGTGIRDLRFRLWLVEVPPQASPQHHRNTARRTRARLELGGVGVGDVAYEHVVVLETRLPEAVDVVFARWSLGTLDAGVILHMETLGMRDRGGSGRVVVGFIVLGVEDDGPARREDGVVGVEVIRFEGEAAEDGLDGQGLPVRQVDCRGCHGLYRMFLLAFLHMLLLDGMVLNIVMCPRRAQTLSPMLKTGMLATVLLFRAHSILCVVVV